MDSWSRECCGATEESFIAAIADEDETTGYRLEKEPGTYDRDDSLRGESASMSRASFQTLFLVLLPPGLAKQGSSRNTLVPIPSP